MENYHKQSVPIMEHYSSVLQKLDATKDKEEVWKLIEAAVNLGAKV